MPGKRARPVREGAIRAREPARLAPHRMAYLTLKGGVGDGGVTTEV